MNEKKAANRLLAAVEENLRSLRVSLDGALYCAGNVRTAITRLRAAHPDAPEVPMSPYAEGQLLLMQADVQLQVKELERVEELLFPGRRERWEREEHEYVQDQRMATMEKYAGYSGE